MNILVVPDSYKGSLTSQKICDVVEKAIKHVEQNAVVTKVPMADGGEGTIEALVLNTNGTIIKKNVVGPLGNQVQATMGLLGDKKTAIIEIAASSGLALVPESKKNPLKTTTYGTGQLILEALDMGVETIIMGIGGSATNDGGAGMLQALGFELLNSNGQEIVRGAEGLLDLRTINITKADDRLKDIRFIIASDVNNPLLGENGASYIYGPQKGATQDMLPILDQALMNFDKAMQKYLNKKVANIPGAGAAGGLGAGLVGFLNAELKPGFQAISEIIGLEKILEDKSHCLVITGEGEINYQTINGKLPVGISRMAKNYGIPVIAIVGSIGEGADKVYEEGIESIVSIVNKPMSIEEAIENAEQLLYNTVIRLFRILKMNKKIN